MTWLAPRPETIPRELRALGWVLWRAEQRGPGKSAKVSYQVRQPHSKASSTDPETWASFEDAVDAYSVLSVDGIGVVLTQPADITCIDLDRVIDR